MTLVEELKLTLKELAPSFSETELATFISEALRELNLSAPTDESRNLVLDIAYLKALKAVLSNFDRYYRFSHEGGSLDRTETYQNLLNFYKSLQKDIEKRKPAFLRSIKLERR
jgi:hypothetical protein